jgi:hemolysin III
VNFGGAGLSWFGLCLIAIMSASAGDSATQQIGYIVHGLGLVGMLNASALYHYFCWDWSYAEFLYCFDKIGINLMIVGCYTPVCLQCSAFRILAFVCSLGAMGLSTEVAHLCGYKCAANSSSSWSLVEIFNLVRYVLMGWAIVFVAPVVIKAFPPPALYLALTGGLLYTVGIVFFVQGSLEFHLAIWHSFVLCASVCFYVLNAAFLVGHHHGPH